jgi:hypothetical protein
MTQPAESDATNTATQPSDGVIAGAPDDPGHDTLDKKAAPMLPNPPGYFDEALNDAERLLKYAAEIGIDIDADTRDHILEARTASGIGWSEQSAANLLTALTKLAALLKPVTAESLKACSNDTRLTVRTYWLVAVCLAIVIVPFSLASFVSSAISNAIRTDIATANDLTVKLRAQLGPPATQTKAATPPSDTPVKPASPLPAGLDEVDVITELQQFASTIRAIDGRARQLNALVFHAERDPFESIRKDPAKIHETFQLPSGLTNFAVAANDQTLVYQDVRYFAQSILDDVSVFYGAITTCLLPVLYALLGTCAYLLRTFEQQMATRTFTPSVANSARFLIAAIGGAVVGLFNNFTITQGPSIPPLAIAFLVGYAVDVFFSFLEGLLQAFTKTKSSTSSPAPPPS